MDDLRDIESGPARSIAYVLKGFPRRSETFIASEIHRLETLGLRLRLIVVMQDESFRHPVIERIQAKPEYLPAAGNLAKQSLPRWLVMHLGGFIPGLLRVIPRRPIGFARA